jgi:hypothetical protein
MLSKHNYVYRQKTNEATRAPQEVYTEAREFLEEFTRPLLLGPHCKWHWIFNMDLRCHVKAMKTTKELDY